MVLSKKKATKKTATSKTPVRKQLGQGDFPVYGLEEALRVAALVAEYGGPTSPKQLAKDLKYGQRRFRDVCTSSIVYGLTDGGAQAAEVKLTDLGRRCVRPQVEGDDVAAKRQAFLGPRIPREFLGRYDGETLPTDPIAINVLDQMGVPRDRCGGALNRIRDEALAIGLCREDGDQVLVRLEVGVDEADGSEPEGDTAESRPGNDVPPLTAPASTPTPTVSAEDQSLAARKKRVFLAHGTNKNFRESLKSLLAFGEIEPVVAEEEHTTAEPVPDKVLKGMRSCGASILHVATEGVLLGQDGEPQRVLNENVLIEIGASMALYGRRFILLVEKGVKLPSNLQGLYRVDYEGGDFTTALGPLLGAITTLKSTPLPEEEN